MSNYVINHNLALWVGLRLLPFSLCYLIGLSYWHTLKGDRLKTNKVSHS
ncbi:hypothetical protein VAE151_630894 [Vibrio aestuarianus]|uniref:Uncharacterized protein n=1 Tax=Vibrio aestuarianus TaxID=28171 RepID=A0ABM9FJL6_9VIBR|nr:hypothetical protein VAE063_1010365 [Vibrio aestuarianus]CAH8229410.1 hypothetical protein VIBAE_B10979 [Vibrio aestuarianus subsp. francensis]CAH8226613.1 hypothetical protein VAE308_1280025 [Vibrio aestuarianus]CAH8231242.1 hypothetical protein VAE032_330368 [Vibrio aestuarianus]CAH8231247.1 hypothetical protein VAE128_500885 [Vibrio aestuarianus]